MNKLLRDARIIAKAAELGFERVDNDFEKLVLDAEYFIRENSDEKPIYERCQLTINGSQYYHWQDELCEYECSGDIVNFCTHYRSSDEKYFKDFDENGDPIFIDWFDIEPNDKVFYVFEELVDCNGRVVRLYC